MSCSRRLLVLVQIQRRSQPAAGPVKQRRHASVGPRSPLPGAQTGQLAPCTLLFFTSPCLAPCVIPTHPFGLSRTAQERCSTEAREKSKEEREGQKIKFPRTCTRRQGCQCRERVDTVVSIPSTRSLRRDAPPTPAASSKNSSTSPVATRAQPQALHTDTHTCHMPHASGLTVVSSRLVSSRPELARFPSFGAPAFPEPVARPTFPDRRAVPARSGKSFTPTFPLLAVGLLLESLRESSASAS
ncbi:hypothetical protein BS50DRAFT_347004 [Corynespora cassiicola Philippines]|uniref:Uncharacterized protein n=1 Tax=Corynespora cassiicola Philippines TaxID=1448308 RepID=A0A2T2NQG5_CORCC|nr:hypothetical protein BS50DRAFT_347004 [Corynespora cassiicola Philippines]